MKRIDIVRLMDEGFSDDDIEAMLEEQRQQDTVMRKQRKQEKQLNRRKPREGK